jgi:predicted phosphoadenosine phosphosulfate sulfurtransferase
MQEVEPETYERLVHRIQGIDMAGKMGQSDYYAGELPFMFASWREYRDYLLEHLISNPDWKSAFQNWFIRFDDALGKDNISTVLYNGQINAILCNDWEGVKLGNRWRDPNIYDARKKYAEAQLATK